MVRFPPRKEGDPARRNPPREDKGKDTEPDCGDGVHLAPHGGASSEEGDFSEEKRDFPLISRGPPSPKGQLAVRPIMGPLLGGYGADGGKMDVSVRHMSLLGTAQPEASWMLCAEKPECLFASLREGEFLEEPRELLLVTSKGRSLELYYSNDFEDFLGETGGSNVLRELRKRVKRRNLPLTVKELKVLLDEPNEDRSEEPRLIFHGEELEGSESLFPLLIISTLHEKRWSKPADLIADARESFRPLEALCLIRLFAVHHQVERFPRGVLEEAEDLLRGYLRKEVYEGYVSDGCQRRRLSLLAATTRYRPGEERDLTGLYSLAKELASRPGSQKAEKVQAAHSCVYRAGSYNLGLWKATGKISNLADPKTASYKIPEEKSREVRDLLVNLPRLTERALLPSRAAGQRRLAARGGICLTSLAFLALKQEKPIPYWLSEPQLPTPERLTQFMELQNSEEGVLIASDLISWSQSPRPVDIETIGRRRNQEAINCLEDGNKTDKQRSNPIRLQGLSAEDKRLIIDSFKRGYAEGGGKGKVSGLFG